MNDPQNPATPEGNPPYATTDGQPPFIGAPGDPRNNVLAEGIPGAEPGAVLVSGDSQGPAGNGSSSNAPAIVDARTQSSTGATTAGEDSTSTASKDNSNFADDSKRAEAMAGPSTNEPILPAAETGPEEKLMSHIRGYLRVARIRFNVGVIDASDATAQAFAHLEHALVHLSKHTQTINAVLENQAQAEKESA